MMFIVLIIIVVAAYLFFFRKPHAGSSSEFASLSNEEKEFRRVLEESERYGADAIEAMEKVAEYYGTGYGTERNIEKAIEWNKRTLLAGMQVKVEVSKFLGARKAFNIKSRVDFLLDGRYVPRDLDKAQEIGEILLKNKYPESNYILQDIYGLKEMGLSAVSKDVSETFQFYQQQAAQGNMFAMYRLSRCYDLGIGVETDNAKASKWLEDSISKGHLLAKCTCYCDDSDGEKVAMQKSAKEENDTEFKTMYFQYVLTRTKESEQFQKTYETKIQTMRSQGITSTRDIINRLLQEAGWPQARADVVFPGSSQELEAQYRKARQLEAQGSDFQNAANEYEIAAKQGHSEAQRRLGKIQRDILGTCEGNKVYLSGERWLKQSANAGNALAAFDLHLTQIDVGFIAGMAAQGDRDALFALGCMMEEGIGGPSNQSIAQCIFRYMKELIGDPIAAKDGEGIEWLRKLGEKEKIFDVTYYIKLADEGSKLGYAPSQAALLHMPEVIMQRAYEENGGKAGSTLDFGFYLYFSKAADAPGKAGFAFAKAVKEYCSKEMYEMREYMDKRMKEAETGTGLWNNSKYKNPQTRVSIQQKSIEDDVLAVYYTRVQQGEEFGEVWEKVRKGLPGYRGNR